MKLTWCLVFLLLLYATSARCTGQHTSGYCSQKPDRDCTNVSRLGGVLTDHQKTILQELCRAGLDHTEERGKQFAVLNIHNDINIDKVMWQAKGIYNYMCEPGWKVDGTESIRIDDDFVDDMIRWYVNGLPLWPLVNQFLLPSHTSRFFRSDWPNYAIATPLYMIQSECDQGRKPTISMEALFADIGKNIFTNSSEFQNFVTSFMKRFTKKDGRECEDEIKDLFSYSKWLQMMIKNVLPNMMRSAKKLNGKKCPQEVYIFFYNSPRYFEDPLRHDVERALTLAKCPKTLTIIGSLLKN